MWVLLAFAVYNKAVIKAISCISLVGSSLWPPPRPCESLEEQPLHFPCGFFDESVPFTRRAALIKKVAFPLWVLLVWFPCGAE